MEKVQIRSLARAADILSDPSKYDPHTKETADHSLPYVIAAAIAERQVTPVQFEMEKIMDPTIRAQLKKVEVVADPEIEKVFPALQRVIVNLTTTDGRTFTKQLDYPKGDPRNPLTRCRGGGEVRGAGGGCTVGWGAEEVEGCDLESGEGRVGEQADGVDEGGCAGRRRRRRSGGRVAEGGVWDTSVETEVLRLRSG